MVSYSGHRARFLCHENTLHTVKPFRVSLVTQGFLGARMEPYSMRWDDKRHGRDERAGGMRERSRSREREQRDWRGDCPQRCSSSGRHSDSVGQGRVHRSDDRDNEYRQWLTAPPPPPPPPPLPRLPAFGAMPQMSASQGRATSSNALPNARALDPRQLTSYLGKARDLPELLALHQRHGDHFNGFHIACLLYTSPSPRDGLLSRMPSSA